jgi:cyclophilin family peptidyl-prolyl cis-trans isomerase
MSTHSTEESPVPTSKQRRETARRRLERQIQRRQEAAAARRRRTQIIASALGVLIVVGAVILIVVKVGGNDTTPAAAQSSSPSPSPSAPSSPPSPTPSRAPKTTTGPCKYTETATSLTNPNAKDVGEPPDPAKTPSTGTIDVDVKTSLGDMTLQLDRSKAPCAVQSMVYLIGKKFFDNTTCPRVASVKPDGLGVLQCGDPSGTTSGGPTYGYKTENVAKADYSVGVVAMAHGQDPTSTASQFFIMTEDGNGKLGKDYSVIGKITKGFDIVQGVAKAGNDGSNQAGGGKPKKPITILSMTLPK